ARAEAARKEVENAKTRARAAKMDKWMSMSPSERAAVRLKDEPSATASRAFEVFRNEEQGRTPPPDSWAAPPMRDGDPGSVYVLRTKETKVGQHIPSVTDPRI